MNTQLLRSDGQLILSYLDKNTRREVPRPFINAGTIMHDLGMPKSRFYMAITPMLGYKIGSVVDGRRRYYYLMEMVEFYRENRKRLV